MIRDSLGGSISSLRLISAISYNFSRIKDTVLRKGGGQESFDFASIKGWTGWHWAPGKVSMGVGNIGPNPDATCSADEIFLNVTDELKNTRWGLDESPEPLEEKWRRSTIPVAVDCAVGVESGLVAITASLTKNYFKTTRILKFVTTETNRISSHT